MRLVSVVVPLWLTATIERVGHVEAQVEPRQLGGGDGVDVERAVEQVVEHRRHAAPGDAAVPWPMTRTLVISPLANRAAMAAGSAALAHFGAQALRRLDDLAAQRLAEAVGRLADLLQQEVRARRRGRCREW